MTLQSQLRFGKSAKETSARINLKATRHLIRKFSKMGGTFSLKRRMNEMVQNWINMTFVLKIWCKPRFSIQNMRSKKSNKTWQHVQKSQLRRLTTSDPPKDTYPQRAPSPPRRDACHQSYHASHVWRPKDSEVWGFGYFFPKCLFRGYLDVPLPTI